MKNVFQKMIYDLFTASICSYVKNMDDVNEGFEFNPNDPRVLIQLLYTIQDERVKDFKTHITIRSFRINTHSFEVIHKQIISGEAILLPDGRIDYGFYETILKNLSNF